jgi:hypothetical protein
VGRKIWLLNILLLAGVALFAYEGYRFWNSKPLEQPLAEPTGQSARTTSPSVPKIPPAPSRDQFQVIEDQNLFTLSRTVKVEEAPPPVAALPVEDPRERYVLYGIIRVGDEKFYALLKDKKMPDSRALVMAVGDSLAGGYSIGEINSKKVLFSGQGIESELLLRTPKGPEDTKYVPKPVSPASPKPARAAAQPRVAREAPRSARVVRGKAPTTVRKPARVPRRTRRVPDQYEEDMEEYYEEDYEDYEEYYEEDYEEYYDEEYYEEEEGGDNYR